MYKMPWNANTVKSEVQVPLTCTKGQYFSKCTYSQIHIHCKQLPFLLLSAAGLVCQGFMCASVNAHPRVCMCLQVCLWIPFYISHLCVCVCASASLCASALCEKWCENASRGACVSSASNMREICGTYLRYDTSQNDMTHPCYIWLIKLQPAKCVSKQQTITKARFDWRHVASYYYH